MSINATGSEDAWQRQAIVEITDGSSTMAMETLTETIDIDMGEREIDIINLINLGQIPKHGAIGITSVTIEGYPLQAGSAGTGTAYGFWDIFASKPVVDNSQPLDVDISNTLTRYRVAVMMTDDPNATTAGGSTAASTAAMRFVMAECFSVSCKTSFTDGIMKQTLILKGVAFDKSAAANIKMESHNDGAMVSLGTYTPGTTKWA